MTFVLDSSVALAWMLPDESPAGIDALFDRLLAEGAIVPGHWPLEVANTLIMAERRGRIDAGFRQNAVRDLMDLPVAVQAETTDLVWGAVMDLAVRSRLTIYDAAYLELARRTGAALATLDTALAAAAPAEGVVVLGVRP